MLFQHRPSASRRAGGDSLRIDRSKFGLAPNNLPPRPPTRALCHLLPRALRQQNLLTSGARSATTSCRKFAQLCSLFSVHRQPHAYSQPATVYPWLDIQFIIAAILTLIRSWYRCFRRLVPQRASCCCDNAVLSRPRSQHPYT